MRSACDAGARSNMKPLYRTLHRAHRTVTSYRLAGVNHLFQAAPAQWPLVNGVQQATFSPPALKQITDWITSETKLPTDPLPVTVKRPATRRKAAKAPALDRLRN